MSPAERLYDKIWEVVDQATTGEPIDDQCLIVEVIGVLEYVKLQLYSQVDKGHEE